MTRPEPVGAALGHGRDAVSGDHVRDGSSRGPAALGARGPRPDTLLDVALGNGQWVAIAEEMRVRLESLQ